MFDVLLIFLEVPVGAARTFLCSERMIWRRRGCCKPTVSVHRSRVFRVVKPTVSVHRSLVFRVVRDKWQRGGERGAACWFVVKPRMNEHTTRKPAGLIPAEGIHVKKNIFLSWEVKGFCILTTPTRNLLTTYNCTKG